MKSITVHFVPELEQEPEVFTSSVDAIGYATPDNDDTYRVWVGKRTTVYPAQRVLKIETNL